MAARAMLPKEMNIPAKTFAQIFNSGFWEDQQLFTDGTLQTDDGTTFRIHRVVLSQRSRYFRALFSFNLNQEPIVIKNTDSKILESILLYIYTGDAILDEKNVLDLMIASDYLLLDDLLENCRSFAIQNVTCTNCLSTLSIAWQIEKLAIRDDCYRYALVHFEDILKTTNGGLEELPFKILKKLLESKSLNVISERSVWKAIVKWTGTDSSSRLPHVPAFLTCLRLEEEVDEELAAEILCHTIVSDNPHCYDLMLSKQFNYYLTKCTLLSQHTRSEAICYQNSPCSFGPRMPNHLYIIARHTLTPTKYGSELFMTYDNGLDFWRQIGETNFFIDTMVQIGQFIYIFNASPKLNLIFDILEEAFLPIRISPGPRHDSYMVTLGEQLYSVGGSKFVGDSARMIYSYEFDRNLWKPIIMPHAIVIYGAVTLKGLIYILGMAELEPAPILICQAYDPEKDDWFLLPPPNIFRRGFSVVVFREQVFVVGGENDEHYLKSAEMYDPIMNTWMSLPDLPYQYFFPKAVIVDNKIIVYENNNDDTRYYEVNPPVYWDQDSWLWRSIDKSSPLYCIERYSFFLLDDHRFLEDITATNRSPGIKWERILPA
ncbi:Kelch-like protein 17 [Araneus ventricosus]|uniref:Kelch-like protein diablo n=1 Tax=Araneus ventricosus TaxID=182803 RepID=A0A4Y2HK14_ARAVE|nr:Kelch-like protein 17 [Araneus ventricosus]